MAQIGLAVTKQSLFSKNFWKIKKEPVHFVKQTGSKAVYIICLRLISAKPHGIIPIGSMQPKRPFLRLVVARRLHGIIPAFSANRGNTHGYELWGGFLRNCKPSGLTPTRSRKPWLKQFCIGVFAHIIESVQIIRKIRTVKIFVVSVLSMTITIITKNHLLSIVWGKISASIWFVNSVR